MKSDRYLWKFHMKRGAWIVELIGRYAFGWRIDSVHMVQESNRDRVEIMWGRGVPKFEIGGKRVIPYPGLSWRNVVRLAWFWLFAKVEPLTGNGD